jgi:hypothetical protein
MKPCVAWAATQRRTSSACCAKKRQWLARTSRHWVNHGTRCRLNVGTPSMYVARCRCPLTPPSLGLPSCDNDSYRGRRPALEARYATFDPVAPLSSRSTCSIICLLSKANCWETLPSSSHPGLTCHSRHGSNYWSVLAAEQPAPLLPSSFTMVQSINGANSGVVSRGPVPSSGHAASASSAVLVEVGERLRQPK